MQWYVYLITISAAALLAQMAVEFVSRPIRTVFRLRREALARMLYFGSRALPKSRELAVTSREIRDYNQAVRHLREAERLFGDLGSQLLALSETEPSLRSLMAFFGLNIALAGRRLIGLSQIYATAKTDSGELRRELKQAFRATSMALAAFRRLSRDDLTKIRLEPIRLQGVAYPRQ